jgi:broad specificity phosphatase PhoE/8-oxo-dGTP pyrophosphatase MutT (NUDIX family)
VRNDPAPVRAAGAVLWRESHKHGVRIALVHRARYDDWSLPKGKAEAGESAPVTAWREVWEETGFSCAVGRALTTVSYSVGGGPKMVDYFAARCRSGAFVPNKEVDRLEWLPIGAARAQMTYEFDKAVLDTFSLERPDLTGVLLVRHARAGHRESFDGIDALRPLDAKGRRQAQALAAELMPFGPGQVHSAPVERCCATVAPLAATLRTTLVLEPLLAEEAYRDDPAAARRRLVELAILGATGSASSTPSSPSGVSVSHPGTVVACSQGGVIPGVVKSLAGRSDVTLPRIGTPKGAFWLLSFDDRRLVQADPYPSPNV